MRIQYDNYTEYGLHSKTDRDILIGYHCLIIISSIIGDTLILVGSLFYNAIKLHKIIVVFIQYIAVADLMFSLFRVIPGAISLAANRWILGHIFCSVGYFVTITFGVIEILLICALSVSKFLIIKFPFRAVSFSKKATHVTVIAAWIVIAIFAGLSVKHNKMIYFSYMSYNCDHFLDFQKDPFFRIVSIILGMVGLVATVLMWVSSVMLLVIAQKVSRRMQGVIRWQGINTVVLTVVMFTISTVPVALSFILTKKYLPRSFNRFTVFIVYLNIISNFYIYTVFIGSFREFLKSIIKITVAPIMKCLLCNKGQRGVNNNNGSGYGNRGERQRLLPRATDTSNPVRDDDGH